MMRPYCRNYRDIYRPLWGQRYVPDIMWGRMPYWLVHSSSGEKVWWYCRSNPSIRNNTRYMWSILSVCSAERRSQRNCILYVQKKWARLLNCDIVEKGGCTCYAMLMDR